MKKKVIVLCSLLIIAMLCVVAVFVIHDRNMTYDTSNGEYEQHEDVISVPGYEGIELKADSKRQTVSLHNPKENTCYMQIELLLEDGTLLWESDLIKPNKKSTAIVLNEELKEGTYPAVLKYSFFKMDSDKTPLNGAETELMLRVK